jgi:hypothetical protein
LPRSPRLSDTRVASGRFRARAQNTRINPED